MSDRMLGLLGQCTPIFSMLCDDHRQRILTLLFDNGKMTVTEITDQLALSRPAVSHHLRLLLDARMVNVSKSGKERYYFLDLQDSLGLIKELVQLMESQSNPEPESSS